jgi:hypothetical protein
MKKDADEIDHGKIAFQARSSCVPSGVPNIFLPGNPLYILQTPKEVVMIKQGNWEYRHVFLNVPHSANVKPSWYGESVGHYEGDTLVVDTIGQNAKTVVDLPHAAPKTVRRGALAYNRWRQAGSEHRDRRSDTFNAPFSTYVRHTPASVTYAAKGVPCRGHLRRQQPQSVRLPHASSSQAGFRRRLRRRG